MTLPAFRKIKQGEDNPLQVRRIHLWEDMSWDESGGHTVAMPMESYENVRKEINRLRRENHELKRKA